jgi:hypothetical protein
LNLAREGVVTSLTGMSLEPEADVKLTTILVAGTLAAASTVLPHGASAAGCLRGAAVGGVVGHYAGHHGVLGAGIGCLWGRHEANKRTYEQDRQDRY